jgi:hypothetical protein
VSWSGHETEYRIRDGIGAEPETRDDYLSTCVEVVRQARASAGCLDFAISADLLDPGPITSSAKRCLETARQPSNVAAPVGMHAAEPGMTSS